jgi:hypothetical protein
MLCPTCKQNQAVAVVLYGYAPAVLDAWALCEDCLANFDPSYTPRKPQRATDLPTAGRKGCELEEHLKVELDPE